MVYENAQVFNNVCHLYRIIQTSSDKRYLKWRSPSNSDVVTFGGIDQEIPIYRTIPDIVEGSLQTVAL